MRSSEAYEPRPLSPSTSKFIVNHSTHENHDLEESPANGLIDANVPNSQLQDSDVVVLRKNIKTRGNTIWRALLRSNRPRGELKGVIDSFALTPQPGDTRAVCQAEDNFTASHTNAMDKEESAPSGEKDLLGYDAQWCWVDSQDDVTFL